MNVAEPPPSQPSDELDALLRAFMRSQLPQSWPPPRWPDRQDVGPTIHRTALGRNLMRSRWALAASVALLFLGAWILPNRWPSDAKLEPGNRGAIIGSDDIRRDFHKNHKQRGIENKNKPGLAADKDDPIPELGGSDLPMLN